MKILFMGRKHVAADALEWLLQSGHEIVGVMTDNHLAVSPTTEVAKRYGLSLLSYEQASSLIMDGGLVFDLAVSMVFWRILKEPFLSHPSLGIVNFHPAPLPEYKGTAGYNMAIMDELDSWAVTAHYVDSGVDTGKIIDAFEFSVDWEEETALSLEKKSQPFLLSLFKKTLKEIFRNGLLPAKENSGGRYVSRKEMECLKKVVTGDDVDKKIRAFWFPPYTGAYIELDGNKYTLVNSKILESLADKTASSLFLKPVK